MGSCVFVSISKKKNEHEEIVCIYICMLGLQHLIRRNAKDPKDHQHINISTECQR